MDIHFWMTGKMKWDLGKRTEIGISKRMAALITRAQGHWNLGYWSFSCFSCCVVISFFYLNLQSCLPLPRKPWWASQGRWRVLHDWADVERTPPAENLPVKTVLCTVCENEEKKQSSQWPSFVRYFICLPSNVEKGIKHWDKNNFFWQNTLPLPVFSGA